MADLQEGLNDLEFLGLYITVEKVDMTKEGINVEISTVVTDWHDQVANAVDRLLESFNEGREE